MTAIRVVFDHSAVISNNEKWPVEARERERERERGRERERESLNNISTLLFP